MTSPATTLRQAYDEAPLDKQYWLYFSLLALCTALDFFDYFIAGFLVSVVAPMWELTYGQSALILLAAGVGGIVGAIIGGYITDRFGRKNIIVSCAILCGLSAGAVAFIPDGAWMLFAFLRFATGVFITCVYVATVAMVTEMTPTRHRTVVATLTFVSPSAGILIATFSSATLLELLGWRGVAMLTALPAVVALICWVYLPESLLWLITNGREKEAREVAQKRLGHPVDDLVIKPIKKSVDKGSYVEIITKYPSRVALIFFIWFGLATMVYGIFAWGPTIVSLSRGVSPQVAAQMFLLVSILGVIGKVVFSFVPQWIGRRWTGILTTGVSMVLVTVGAFTHSMDIWGYPLFLVFISIAQFFHDGGGASISPYSTEVFPVRLAGRGAAIGQFGSGVGKIVGPLGLAIIAGTDNIVAPKATAEAILPGFLFLTTCLATSFLAYIFFGVETRDMQLDIESEEDAPQNSSGVQKSIVTDPIP